MFLGIQLRCHHPEEASLPPTQFWVEYPLLSFSDLLEYLPNSIVAIITLDSNLIHVSLLQGNLL